ncbi:MAG: GWxTD domain-containing protein [Rhodothermales bacterium]|nr:GWxTD domain-containing protein [Rhodothermales bacterium]MBO6778458.1 GWxTD domain-containing protein [Rhodothermales bacterium]
MLILLLVAARTPAHAQEVIPEFYVDAMTVWSGDDSGYNTVDLYTRIPFRRLTFVRSSNGFRADYVVTVDALLRNGDELTSTPVQTRIWEGTARADLYLATESEDLSAYTTQSLQLPAGVYQLAMQVEDRNSNQVFVREMDVQVRDFSASQSLSDIAILDNYDQATLQFIPRVTGNVGTDELGVQILYETYSDRSAAMRLRHEVVRLVRETDGSLLPAPEGSEPDVDRHVVHEESQEVRLESGRNQHVINIPLRDMEAGPHIIRVILEDQDGVPVDFATKDFTARWMGLQQHISNVEEAIEQLEYTAKKKDIAFIREGATEADRYRRFLAFWDKRDPTPGTARNEVMEEYYYRVSFANRRYTSLIEGWKTDRGFVLVRYGEPDFVRKKPHTFNYEPYEVWIYERIGRQFIFVDKTGFGDYELLVPIWDERTRLY